MTPGGRAGRAAAGLLAAALLAAPLAGCDGDGAPLDPEARAAPIDLSRVVVVGDGFAAGVSDDALYASAQRASLLGLLTGAGDAAQPLVADPGFSVGDADGGRLALVDRLPLTIERLPRGGPLLASPPAAPYANLGVPGALVAEALVAESGATSLLGNPFYDLVLRDRGTFVEQVAEADPSLVLLWIGAGDVLPWIAGGGDDDVTPGLPTPAGTFASIYERLVDGLLESTERVVLFTIPDFTTLPVVRAIPPFVLDPETGEPVVITIQVPRTDPETGEVLLDEDGDTLKMSVESRAPLIGPAGDLAEDDLVPLEALDLLEAGIGIPEFLDGTGEPLPDRGVLDAGERAIASLTIASYNQTIRRVAAERDLPLVDVAVLVERLGAGGVISDGVRLTSEWLLGQAFGLDGAHFTPKGYGIVTNLLIETLNEEYGSRLRPVRTVDLPGVPLLGL